MSAELQLMRDTGYGIELLSRISNLASRIPNHDSRLTIHAFPSGLLHAQLSQGKQQRGVRKGVRNLFRDGTFLDDARIISCEKRFLTPFLHPARSHSPIRGRLAKRSTFSLRCSCIFAPPLITKVARIESSLIEPGPFALIVAHGAPKRALTPGQAVASLDTTPQKWRAQQES